MGLRRGTEPGLAFWRRRGKGGCRPENLKDDNNSGQSLSLVSLVVVKRGGKGGKPKRIGRSAIPSKKKV